MLSTSASAPKTPSSTVTMCSAARCASASPEPQASRATRHSKPRSLASRRVQWTQTSVVTPARISARMPWAARMAARSVPQKALFAVLSMMNSPGAGASSGMIWNPGSPRMRKRPSGPGLPIGRLAGLDARQLMRGHLRQVRPVALARVEDAKAGAARSRQQAARRLDGGAHAAKVVAHRRQVARGLQEVALHVDQDERDLALGQAVVGEVARDARRSRSWRPASGLQGRHHDRRFSSLPSG